MGIVVTDRTTAEQLNQQLGGGRGPVISKPTRQERRVWSDVIEDMDDADVVRAWQDALAEGVNFFEYLERDSLN